MTTLGTIAHTQSKIDAAIPPIEQLLKETSYSIFPKIGDVVKGTVVSVGRNEVRIDVAGIAVGIVRGPELDPSLHLTVGDNVEATILDLDNECGELELSFKGADRKKAWDKFKELLTSRTVIPVKVLEANKGGLIVRLDGVAGFLPVSQLSPENYPRVSGGEKTKILEKLKELVGGQLDVRIIDVNEESEKLIVSEKTVWETEQVSVISKYKIGDIVEGVVTALTDFGAFVRFDTNLEGLVHISEIAWQRIDHPQDVLKIGDAVRAEIIHVEGSKIFLSMKKLVEDPWKRVGNAFRIGQIVRGRVLKINPFGLFVELNPDIHGLAHISELSNKPVKDVHDIARVGDEINFSVISIDPENHRLGLSLRKAKEEKQEETV